MNVQGIPPLPAEAGECEIMYGKPIEGDLIHSLDGWRERAVLSVYSSPCWLIARPVPPKRLEWKRDYSTSGAVWRSGDYWITANGDGLFGCSIYGPVFATLAEAKAACEAHADAQRKPVTIAKTPAVAIEWPEGAIVLTRDENGEMNWIDSTGCWGSSRHDGPSPFPADLDWRQCYLINPACLPK